MKRDMPAGFLRALAEAEQIAEQQGSIAAAHEAQCLKQFPTPAARGSVPPDGMNGLERDWAQVLEARRVAGEVLWWRFQPWALNLGGGAKFRPDFGALLAPDGEITCFEVKGFWREAARVRIKIAASIHPFNFVAVTRDSSGAWIEEAFQ